MVLLGLADHNILTFGTYGLFSALLSKNYHKKMILMPRGYDRLEWMRSFYAANLTNWLVV